MEKMCCFKVDEMFRVFKASCPFVSTLMWCVKTLVHYLLLRRSRFNMHQLLCMKLLLRETGLMIIFICAPPGIFNSISAKQKRQIMRAQTEMWCDSDNRPFISGVWCRCSSSPLTFDLLNVQLSISLIWEN